MLYVMVFLFHVYNIYVAFALLMCGRLLLCASLSPIFLQSPLIEPPEQYTLAFKRPPDERIKKQTQKKHKQTHIYISLYATRQSNAQRTTITKRIALRRFASRPPLAAMVATFRCCCCCLCCCCRQKRATIQYIWCRRCQCTLHTVAHRLY